MEANVKRKFYPSKQFIKSIRFCITAHKSVYVNPNFQSIDCVLYSKNQTIIYRYPPGNTTTFYEIKSKVTTIFSFAFLSIILFTA